MRRAGSRRHLPRRPDVDRATPTVERQHLVGHRPRLLDAVLDQDDRRRSSLPERPDALEERGRARADRGWRSARRARAGRAARPARRRGRGAAAARPTGAACDAVRARPARLPRAPRERARRIRSTGQLLDLESERDVVLDALHDQLGRRILEDQPDPRRQGRSVEAGHGRSRRARATLRPTPGRRAGSGRRWPARACSCPTPTARRRATCCRPADRT